MLKANQVEQIFMEVIVKELLHFYINVLCKVT